ncbi:hypothetical protein BpHYR1_002552, partial [Brachionus plicatilis]
MSSQKGNDSRSRPQKHKNTRAFKNDLHDSSFTTKRINNLEFYGICDHCKEIIDWKVKYKKYKLLTTPKKCVKCFEKKVKDSYYIVCRDCSVTHKICSKCSKPHENLEFGKSQAEKQRKEEQFYQELKHLNERQRRKLLRLLENGAFSKEDFMDDPNLIKTRTQESDDEFDDEDENEEDEEYSDEEDQQELKTLPKDDGDEDYETLDEEDEDDEDDEEDLQTKSKEKSKKVSFGK